MIISVDRRVYHKMTTSGEKYNIVRDKFTLVCLSLQREFAESNGGGVSCKRV